MIWIRLDTEKAEILGADEHPTHGEWIEWGEARRIIREHNEREARSEIGPGHDPTGEGSAWQWEAAAKSAGPVAPEGWREMMPAMDPKGRPGERTYCGRLIAPDPSIPGSGPQLRKTIQAIQDGAETQKKLDLQWEAAKALEQERNQLVAQVARLKQERDAATGRAVLAEREAAELRNGWKDLAEAPRAHNGMKVSIRGFIGRVSEYLDRKGCGGDAFQLREIQRHLCEVWRRRGEPGIVAEFGALYCLDKDGPIEEPEDDEEEGGEE